jgi:hypothetical protein
MQCQLCRVGACQCNSAAAVKCIDLLQVVASSLDTLEPVLLEGFESKEDLVACLKASANVPRIAGEPLQHRWAPFKALKTRESTSRL